MVTHCVKCKSKLSDETGYKRAEGGYHSYCKLCNKLASDKYRKQHLSQDRKRKNDWAKKWRQENPEKAKEKDSLDNKKRRSSIEGNLRNLIGNRIRMAIKGCKKSSTTSLIGCTLKKAREHLEAQFQPGMTWLNQGDWHIDHIKPCASFDLTKESEQKICFHYTNLQPLWALDNLKKGAIYPYQT